MSAAPIDLRSDTVTRPTDAMRAAMAAAPYQKDPVVKIFSAPPRARFAPAMAASGQPLASALE